MTADWSENGIQKRGGTRTWYETFDNKGQIRQLK